MATIRIATFWHGSAGWKIEEGTPKGVVTYPNGGGYESLQAMQKELCRRFPHRKPEKLPNGVRMEGDSGTYQLVTWEE